MATTKKKKAPAKKKVTATKVRIRDLDPKTGKVAGGGMGGFGGGGFGGEILKPR